MAKNNSLPSWVVDGIKNVKFSKPKKHTSPGTILELYAEDLKVDVQLDAAVEDGRHIVTMDISKKIDLNSIERSVIFEISFEESKGKIDSKIVEYLKETKEVDMDSIYQFNLLELKKIAVD